MSADSADTSRPIPKNARTIDVLLGGGRNNVRIEVKGCHGILQTAWLLAQAFGTLPRFWLNLQAIYELAVATKEGRIREVAAIST